MRLSVKASCSMREILSLSHYRIPGPLYFLLDSFLPLLHDGTMLHPNPMCSVTEDRPQWRGFKKRHHLWLSLLLNMTWYSCKGANKDVFSERVCRSASSGVVVYMCQVSRTSESLCPQRH